MFTVLVVQVVLVSQASIFAPNEMGHLKDENPDWQKRQWPQTSAEAFPQKHVALKNGTIDEIIRQL